MKTRLAAFGAAIALTAGGLALTASSAHAGVTPTPTHTIRPPVPVPTSLCRGVRQIAPTDYPTDYQSDTPYLARHLDNPVPSDTPQPFGVVPSHNFVPQPRQVCNWQFDLAQLDIGTISVNDVEQFGALGRLHNWTDTQLSPTLDRFSGGGSSLVLRHGHLPIPTVNTRTCTVTFVQNNAPFSLVTGSGTGIGAHIASIGGRYDLVALLSFPESASGHCPISSVSPFTLRNDVENGTPPVQPTEADVAVQGAANLVRV